MARRRRLGKFDGDIYTAKIFSGDSAGVAIVGAIEAQLHGESVFRRELLDQSAHLAVTDDGEIHGRVRGALWARTLGVQNGGVGIDENCAHVLRSSEKLLDHPFINFDGLMSSLLGTRSSSV